MEAILNSPEITNNVLNTSSQVAEIITKLGSIGLWLQAIGLIGIIWIAFQIINWILNRKRMKRLERIEEKLDKILKKH